MKNNIHLLSYLAQFLECEMFQTKVIQKIKPHISCSGTFFPENRGVYEIMWKNFVQQGRPQMTIWRMRFACWVTKATDTHSEYAILTAFPRQQWSRERASMWRYTYIACLLKKKKDTGRYYSVIINEL